MGSEARGVERRQDAGGSRVLLLLDAAGDRRVLATWLGDTHEIVEATADSALEDEFDLCILDDGTYARLWARIADRKRRSEPVFLPFLLITSDTTAHLLAEIPKHDIDESLEAPVQREYLTLRVDVLLGRRRHEARLQAEREEALGALKESEAKANDLIRYAPTGIYEIDFREQRFVSVNDAMVALTGYSRDELLAMDAFELLDDASRRLFEQRIAAMAAGQTPTTDVEYCVIRKDGTPIFVVLNVRFTRDEHGVPKGAFVIGHDVTERRRTLDALEASRQRFEILSEANSLLLASPDPEATIQVIAEQVMRHLHADVFFNYVLDPSMKRLRLNAWGGVDQRVAKMIERLELGQAICGCVARDGERIISNDVQNNGDARADLVRRMGVRCYVCHPLKAGERTLGTLSFGTKAKDCFDDDEIELMRTVANQVSIAMSRAQTESERAFQSFLLAAVSDSVFAYYPDEPDKGKLVYFNDAACIERGYTRDEMSRLNVMDLIAPDWRSRLQPRLDKLAVGEEVRAESAHVRKDGTTFPVEVWLRQVDFGGRPLVVNVSRDITERKHYEERLQASLETTTQLLEAADALASSAELGDVLDALTDVVLRVTGHSRVNVSLFDEATGTFATAASQGGIPIPLGVTFDSSSLSEPARLAVSTLTTQRIDYDAITSGNRGLADRFGSHLALDVPLVYSDKLVGLLAVDDPGERVEFSERDVRLIEGIAAQAAVAIENARLFQERTRQAEYAEALNRINAAVHSSLEFDEIMKRVVGEVREALDVDAAIVQLHREGYWEFTHEVGLPAELRDAKPSDEEAPLSMSMLSGEPVIVNDVDRDDRVNPEIMRRFGIKSLLGTPIVVRSQVIGVLLADRFGSARPFTDQQLDFLRKAAATLGLALENARLYETEHDIADRLQSALLALPDEVPGVAFAHQYHSATEAARVGGDFYDLFDLDHDHVGIVIGDVAGKGIDAAVLTSMVKNTIRAHASERGKTPKRILGLTNEVVYKATTREAFVTVFFGILDCRDGRLTYGSAGHTTTALLRTDGTVDALPVTGPLLGAFEDVRFDEAESRLGIGDLLFLYTDGLTEARHDGELYGEQRVFARLSATRGEAVQQVVDDMLADVVDFSGDRLRDDLAVLVVQRVAQDTGTPHQQKLEM